MSEKTEKKLKIAINCFMVVAVIVVALCLWSNSQYSPNDHSLEQGHLPVYVTPPGEEEGQNSIDYEELLANFDATAYEYAPYNEMADACANYEARKLKIKGTIYSRISTSSTVMYNIADADGNYYVVFDQSQGVLPTFNKSDVIIVYCEPHGMSKMNAEEVPQVRAHFFEEVE